MSQLLLILFSLLEHPLVDSKLGFHVSLPFLHLLYQQVQVFNLTTEYGF